MWPQGQHTCRRVSLNEQNTNPLTLQLSCHKLSVRTKPINQTLKTYCPTQRITCKHCGPDIVSTYVADSRACPANTRCPTAQLPNVRPANRSCCMPPAPDPLPPSTAPATARGAPGPRPGSPDPNPIGPPSTAAASCRACGGRASSGSGPRAHDESESAVYPDRVAAGKPVRLTWAASTSFAIKLRFLGVGLINPK